MDISGPQASGADEETEVWLVQAAKVTVPTNALHGRRMAIPRLDEEEVNYSTPTQD